MYDGSYYELHSSINYNTVLFGCQQRSAPRQSKSDLRIHDNIIPVEYQLEIKKFLYDKI